MSGLSSSKCVDDSAFSTADGNKIQMWDCTGGVYQQWHLPEADMNTLSGQRPRRRLAT